MNNTEIERKFLISLPDMSVLSEQPGFIKSTITQTYLLNMDGYTERVRERIWADSTIYYHTLKKRISKAASYESESEIDIDEYNSLLKKADPKRNKIIKQRCVIPYADHKLEIDIYPFWKKQAVLEIELASEDEDYSIPEYINVLREVTGDHAYSNSTLASHIPDED